MERECGSGSAVFGTRPKLEQNAEIIESLESAQRDGANYSYASRNLGSGPPRKQRGPRGEMFHAREERKNSFN